MTTTRHTHTAIQSHHQVATTHSHKWLSLLSQRHWASKVGVLLKIYMADTKGRVTTNAGLVILEDSKLLKGIDCFPLALRNTKRIANLSR